MIRDSWRRRLTRAGIPLLLVVVFLPPIDAQDSPFGTGLSVTTEATLPVGAKAEFYQFGIGARLESILALGTLPAISPQVDLAYTLVPLSLNEGGFLSSSNLSLVRAGLGAKATLPFGDRFAGFARAYGGGFVAALSGASEQPVLGVAFGGGVGLTILPTDRILLQISSSYDSYLNLYDGVSVAVGATVKLGGSGGPAIPPESLIQLPEAGPAEGFIEFLDIQIDRVFPSLYKYYNGNPIGRATIRNISDTVVEDIEVEIGLMQYMDAPRVSARIDRLAPGERHEFEVFALFTEDVLEITEGALVAAEMRSRYRVEDRQGGDIEVITLSTYDRNALQWDDDEKIAAFVTSRDEQIQRFARNVVSMVRNTRIDALGNEVRNAVALLTAMNEHGIAYTIDPGSAYEDFSQNPIAIDSVQFPIQTLEFRAGDCDDLSATYAAMLQSVGIKTAFVTIPGHIYMAFKLEAPRSVVLRSFSNPDDLIVRGDDVWIPVETTLLDQGFLRAWSVGAQQWRDNDEKAQLYPVEDAWLTYQPVEFSVSSYEVEVPPSEIVLPSFETEFERVVNREVVTQSARLVDRLEERPDDYRTRNRLGVLFARFGRTADAQQQFEQIIEAQPYPQALINLGNLLFLQKDLVSARQYYERAAEEDPENVAGILGVARVNYADERYEEAAGAHQLLQSLAPDVAQRFGYLGGQGSSGGDGDARASDAARLEREVVWGE